MIKCEHGKTGYCGFCAAKTAPKRKVHGHPWACGWCGTASSNPDKFTG